MNFFLKILIVFVLASKMLPAVSPDLFFTAPNNDDTLYYNSQVKISWENKNGRIVKLLFSIDRGKTWNLLGQDLTENEISWNVPKFQSDKIILRLSAIENEDVELIRKIEKAHSNEIRCLDVSDDGKYLLSSSRDSKIKIWSIEKNELIDSLSSFTNENFFNAFFYNNKVVATLDSAVMLWNRENGKIDVIGKNLINDAIRSCAVNSKDKVIAAGTFDGRVYLIKEDFQRIPIEITLPDSAIVYSLNFSNKGNLLAATTYSGHIYLIDWEKEQIKSEFSGHGESGNQNLLVWDCSFSKNDDYLISCGVDKTVRYWDLINNLQIQNIALHTSHVRAVDYHSRFDIGISAGLDSSLIQTDRTDGTIIGNKIKADGQILTALYSVTGDTIFSAGRDNSIYIWKNKINKIDVDEIACFLLKYVEPVVDENEIVISPNPVSDFAEIKFFLKDAADFSINLVDLSGKNIYNKYFTNIKSGLQIIKINLWEISSGYYTLCIKGNNFSKCKSCLIVK